VTVCWLWCTGQVGYKSWADCSWDWGWRRGCRRPVDVDWGGSPCRSLHRSMSHCRWRRPSEYLLQSSSWSIQSLDGARTRRAARLLPGSPAVRRCLWPLNRSAATPHTNSTWDTQQNTPICTVVLTVWLTAASCHCTAPLSQHPSWLAFWRAWCLAYLTIFIIIYYHIFCSKYIKTNKHILKTYSEKILDEKAIDSRS